MDTGRLLIATDVTMPGGVDTYVLDLCRYAHADGWEPHALIDHGGGSDRLHRMLVDAGVPVTREGLYWREAPARAREQATAGVLDAFRPDVVHAVCGAPWNTIVPRETVLDRGVPLHFTEQYVPPSAVLDPDTTRRLARIYREARTVVAVSRENADRLTGPLGLPGDRLVVIPNSIETDAAPSDRADVERFRSDLPGAEFQAVALARYEEVKGLDVLIEAVARLDDGARSRIRFSLIGEGSEREALDALIRERGVGDRIALLGWLPDAARRLPAFDLFVLPSRAEGLPFTVLEALAAGLPVIATDVSGTPEALAGGDGGDLVPVDDPDALAAAIARFVEHPDELRRKAERGRNHAREHHNLSRNMQILLKRWRMSVDVRG